MIAVDVSNDVPGARQFYADNGFTIPVAFDVGQEVALQGYGVIGTPTNYLLDHRGRIVWRHYGFEPGDEVEVEEEVLAALAAAGSE